MTAQADKVLLSGTSVESQSTLLVFWGGEATGKAAMNGKHAAAFLIIRRMN